LIIANRTSGARARAGGAFAGYAIALDEIPAHLGEADIVIAAPPAPV
jgi:glutamyl-tRNA reductase